MESCLSVPFCLYVHLLAPLAIAASGCGQQESAGQRYPLACLRLQSADAMSTHLLAVESLQLCFGTTGQEPGKSTLLPSSTIPGKVFLLLGRL